MARLENVGMIIIKTARQNIIGGTKNFAWPKLQYQDSRYRELIKDKFLIVGRKTFESLTEISPDHTYLVLSDNDPNGIKESEQENIKVFWRVSHLMQYVGEKPAIVIGGCSVFKRFERYVSYLHLTEVNQDIEGDVTCITNLSLIPVSRLDIKDTHSFIDYVVKNSPMDNESSKRNFSKKLNAVDRLILSE